MKERLKTGIVVLWLVIAGLMVSGQTFSLMEVSEADGTPLKRGVKRLVLPNGSLTVAGNTVTMAPTWTFTQFLVDATNTAAGQTGAKTINNRTGSVNFAASATSLVVTCNKITANSLVFPVVMTNDATMTGAVIVPGSGNFTIYPNAPPTAETRVGFFVVN